MKRTVMATLVAGLTLFIAAGCGGKGGGGGGGSGKAMSKAERADRALGAKLAPYIELANRFFDRVHSSKRRYLSWVKDPATGPTCKERHIYGLYKIYDLAKYPDKIQAANDKTPKLKKLEDAATNVLAAMEKLGPLIKKANRYYSQKDYKDDDCKIGIEMHSQLMKQWKAFADAEKVFSGIVFKQSRALHERLLGYIVKKHGKGHQRYYHKKVALDARALLRMLPEGKAEAANAATALKAFDKLVQEMDKNAKKGGKEPSGYSRFRNEANHFVKACKERVRRLKKGKGYSKWEQRSIAGGSGWMVKGSYAKVVKAFNSMIDASNSVRYG